METSSRDGAAAAATTRIVLRRIAAPPRPRRLVLRYPEGPPWAPTANIMIKRVWNAAADDDDEAALSSRATFDERCPRNGGAEDVELCARARAAGLHLKAAPGARAAHDLWPWRGVKYSAGNQTSPSALAATSTRLPSRGVDATP